MSIILPEIALKEELEIILRWCYDDLIAKETIGIVTDASNVDAGATIIVLQQGGIGIPEKTKVTLTADTNGSLAGKHWLLNTPSAGYYVWYSVSSTGTDPLLGTKIGIKVDILINSTANAVAVATAAALSAYRDRSGANVFVVPVPTTADITVMNKETDATRRSLLYSIFGNVNFEKYDYFAQAGKILKSKFESEKRKLEIHLGYDQNRVTFPAINIMLPSEENQPKQTGVTGGLINYGDGTMSDENLHAYQDTYDLLITSDNMNDVVVVYNMIKTLLLMGMMHLNARGMENVWIGGRDIMMDFELDPMTLFHRTIAVSFFYQNLVPDLSDFTPITAIAVTGNPVP